jgi:glycosyltransferase involved in cell wall biosynthesis
MSGSDSGRIAFFLPSLEGGGAERAVSNLASGVAAAGRPVDLVLAKAEGPYLRGLSEKVRVVDLSAGRVLKSLPRLARYLREVRPQIMVSAMDHANLAALLARKLAGSHTRVFVSVRTTVSISLGKFGNFESRFILLLMRVFYRRADGIIAISRGVAEDLTRTIGVPRDRIQVLYNPAVHAEVVQMSKEEPGLPDLLSGPDPVVLSVGRLTRAKDYPCLLRAFSLLRERRRARLLILGEGEERPKLESLVRELGLQGQVALPGFVQNPYSYMSRAAVFALSSAWEGLSCVLIEAMACGCPVVSTDCQSGPAEILENGRYGPLVPVGDASALAEAIEKLLDAPPAQAALQGRAARFSVDAIAREFLEIIRQ